MKRTLSVFFLVLVVGRADAAAQVVAIRAGRLAVPETGATLSNQIDAFVEAGIPARVILQAMTTNAARLLGVDKERGAIAPGQFADIVAAPDNPLDDVRALTRIDFVMKHGQVIRQPK